MHTNTSAHKNYGYSQLSNSHKTISISILSHHVYSSILFMSPLVLFIFSLNLFYSFSLYLISFISDSSNPHPIPTPHWRRQRPLVPILHRSPIYQSPHFGRENNCSILFYFFFSLFVCAGTQIHLLYTACRVLSGMLALKDIRGLHELIICQSKIKAMLITIGRTARRYRGEASCFISIFFLIGNMT